MDIPSLIETSTNVVRYASVKKKEPMIYFNVLNSFIKKTLDECRGKKGKIQLK